MAKRATSTAKKTEPETTKTDAAPAAETKQEAAASETAAQDITIHDEILDLCRAHDKKFAEQSSKEPDDKFVMRMMTLLGEVPEETFDTLSKGAQEWFNTQVHRANAKETIEVPPGFLSKFGAEPKKTAAANGKAKEKGSEKKKAPLPRQPQPRSESKTYGIRLAVAKNPSVSLDDLKKMFPNTNTSTISTVRSDSLATVDACKEAGWKLPA